jgi:sec-independent protein translocase protein TatA
MFGIGMPELIIILVIALLFFGPGKLPQVGSSIGKAIRDFKGSMNDSERPLEEETKDTETKHDDRTVKH